MGELIDKVKGTFNEVIGKAKADAGHKTDDATLIAEGKVQQAKGAAQKLKGSVKGAFGDNL